MQAVQPPQGRQDARGGAAPPAPAAVRAAQRHLLAVHAVPRRRAQRGLADLPVPGPQLTRPRPADRAAIAGGDPGRRPRPARDPLGGRPRGVRRRRLAARRRPAAGRRATGTSRPTRCPERVVELVPGRRLREPVRDRRGPARRRRPVRDHDVPDRPRLRRLPAAAPGRVRRHDRGRPRPPRLHGATRWPGAPGGGRPVRPALVDPYDGRGRHPRRTSCGPSASRGTRFEEDALRMIRAVRLAATLGFDDRAGDAGRRSRRRAELVAPPVRRADRGRARQAARRAERPSIGLRLLARHRACSRRSRRSWRPSAACRRTRSPGEDLWDHTLRTVDAAPAGAPGRPAGGAAPRHRQAVDVRRRPFPAVTTSSARSWPATFLDRLRSPRAVRERVVHLVRHHMFSYEPNWSRRGRPAVHRQDRPGDALDDLFELREADNVGSRPAGGRRAARRAPRARRRASSRRGRRPRPAATSRSTATT